MLLMLFCFFFNDTAPTECYSLSLHDALPILSDPHARTAYADNHYPSARACGECHPTQFAEWSLSSHAYAAVSPMFNKDRKSTRLNSSHANISYAVFCLKKKKTNIANYHITKI